MHAKQVPLASLASDMLVDACAQEEFEPLSKDPTRMRVNMFRNPIRLLGQYRKRSTLLGSLA